MPVVMLASVSAVLCPLTKAASSWSCIDTAMARERRRGELLHVARLDRRRLLDEHRHDVGAHRERDGRGSMSTRVGSSLVAAQKAVMLSASVMNFRNFAASSGCAEDCVATRALPPRVGGAAVLDGHGQRAGQSKPARFSMSGTTNEPTKAMATDSSVKNESA